MGMDMRKKEGTDVGTRKDVSRRTNVAVVVSTYTHAPLQVYVHVCNHKEEEPTSFFFKDIPLDWQRGLAPRPTCKRFYRDSTRDLQ